MTFEKANKLMASASYALDLMAAEMAPLHSITIGEALPRELMEVGPVCVITTTLAGLISVAGHPHRGNPNVFAVAPGTGHGQQATLWIALPSCWLMTTTDRRAVRLTPETPWPYHMQLPELVALIAGGTP